MAVETPPPEARFDLNIGFCASVRIWRISIASNWRVISEVFCSSVSAFEVASFSSGMSAGFTFARELMEGIGMLPHDQFGLQSAGLFHCLKD